MLEMINDLYLLYELYERFYEDNEELYYIDGTKYDAKCAALVEGIETMLNRIIKGVAEKTGGILIEK